LKTPIHSPRCSSERLLSNRMKLFLHQDKLLQAPDASSCCCIRRAGRVVAQEWTQYTRCLLVLFPWWHCPFLAVADPPSHRLCSPREVSLHRIPSIQRGRAPATNTPRHPQVRPVSSSLDRLLKAAQRGLAFQDTLRCNVRAKHGMPLHPAQPQWLPARLMHVSLLSAMRASHDFSRSRVAAIWREERGWNRASHTR